ncbi:MAG: NAD(P)-dependent oxidoreductase [Polyangiales bacterium]|jgi:nucleoside-diphosphate-sugar epimerase
MRTTALLTGAAGKVGKYVIGALARRGIGVVATDIVSEGVPRDVRFEPCDLTDAHAVSRLVALVKPDVVVHCAAIVAPVSYAEPALAEAVNLGGTKHLIDATKQYAPDGFFVFVSSYAAFGPCSPNDPVRRSTDPCWPDDTYGLQKLTAEGWLRYSGLRQCSLRLGAVMDLGNLMPKHPSYRPFVFMVALEQPEHGIDVRDAARAIASAAVLQPDGHLFLIGGDDSWKVQARQLRGEIFGAMGLSMPPESAFRPATDPSVDDGWFYECWMDERQSERVLGFQRITREAFMDELRKRHRLRRAALSPLRPLLWRTLAGSSPYQGKHAIEPGATLWDDICRVYELPTTVARARSSVPPPPSPFIGSSTSISSPGSLLGS